ncbi:threonine synthase [Mesorhizobium sp. B2-5-7]|uniref:threonine synthase n=1 Tax=Mesorhizobium sp. B2-5-7 TaxID=2589923 RepID=UPI001FF07984|nr:threonine synthase [Mesorhizobium sp. B2-5-7]
MHYISTRGHPERRKFCEILLEGLAPDSGLYVPETYPRVDDAMLDRWRRLSYPDLAFEILSLYIDDIPPADLKAICAKTYTSEIFGTARIAPVRALETCLHVAELSNGPTLAFKDMAMQLLGNLLEYELARRGEELNILGATSGDTGSAAEYAMRGKKEVRVFMMSPHGRMSTFQQAQMFSLQDENIHNIAIEGVFDDCQDIVKAVSGDGDFKRRHRIGAVNSINWARLVAQVVYYFSAYFQVTAGNASEVDFTVPSGNFGNICAGHVARTMGLPVSAPAYIACGAGRTRTKHQAHRWTFPRPPISSVSSSTCSVAMRAGRNQSSTTNSGDEARSISVGIPPSRRWPLVLASAAARARTPTGWKRSVTLGAASTRWSTHTQLTASRSHAGTPSRRCR